MSKPQRFTKTEIVRWIRRAEERAVVFCPRYPGLHLFRNVDDASWRLRCVKKDGKKEIKTLGRFPEVNYREAIQLALQYERLSGH
jgi:hypothetical protein